MKSKAKESAEIRKVRKKLKKRLEADQRRITKPALEKMSQSIQEWLARHANERLPLKKKSFVVFDENRHPAKTKNLFILKLLKELKMQKSTPNHLFGRVSTKEALVET